MTNSPVRRGKYNTVDVNEVHSNVCQEVIEITSDKLRLILNEHIELMTARRDWQAPLTMLVTILIVICTAEFKDAWGLSKDTWSAIFIISALFSAIWLVRSLLAMRKALTVEDILNIVKNKT